VRLLHTGDWHLGRRLFGIDRLGEARAALAEIREIAARERVDAVLVAGDLTDRRMVEPAVLGACLEALEGLAEVAPVVAITGNHDDPDLWDHLAPYLRPRITLVSRVRPPAEAALTLEAGGVPLHVACLPWPDPKGLALEPGVDAARAHGLYADTVADLVDEYADELRRRRREAGGAAVLLAHLMVDRARPGGGERELTLGQLHAVAGGRVPQDLDYVALGHVHRSQQVPGLSGPGRYAGSPLALDFSEEGAGKCVVVVDLGDETGRAREVRLRSGRGLVRIRGPLEALPTIAADHPGAFFFCEVDLERPVLDLVREVRERVPDALRVEARYGQRIAKGGEDDRADAPRSLLEHYADWHEEIGRPWDPALGEALTRLVGAAEDGGEAG
jgi:exonuclease SbcD